MKRYLISDNRNTIRIRDRKTNQEKIITFVDDETKKLIVDAIKSVNYSIPNKKSHRINNYSMPISNYQGSKEWGEFPPVNMKWESKNTQQSLNNRLNKILEA